MCSSWCRDQLLNLLVCCTSGRMSTEPCDSTRTAVPCSRGSVLGACQAHPPSSRFLDALCHSFHVYSQDFFFYYYDFQEFQDIPQGFLGRVVALLVTARLCGGSETRRNASCCSVQLPLSDLGIKVCTGLVAWGALLIPILFTFFSQVSWLEGQVQQSLPGCIHLAPAVMLGRYLSAVP